MTEQNYPIGLQDFAEIRQSGKVYIDKTSYVYRLAHGNKYYFLSRPRRFGKTLLLSTLEYFFQGRKDLFEGLEIEKLEKDWRSYPVLHFDFSTIEADTDQTLKGDIEYLLEQYEQEYGVEFQVAEGKRQPSLGQRFGNLIKSVHKVTGKEVVVLIDEYDKGILEVIKHEKKLNKNRRVLRNFFTQLKANDKHLRFVMLTGVSRFRHLTIFSGLNNLTDISMSTDYACVCGITIEEMRAYLNPGISGLAEAKSMDADSMIEVILQKYDGYRFSSEDQHVCNPYSLLKVLQDKKLNSYWVMTGTSKVFIDYISESDFVLDDLLTQWYDEDTLASTFDSKKPVPLLYQTGYLTIKEAKDDKFYQLSIPNGEVREALIMQLLPMYMGVASKNIPGRLIALKEKVLSGNIDGWLTDLQSLISTAPYQLLVKDEQNPVERFYHLMIYQAFVLLGIEAQSEISVAGGRIDMVAKTPEYIYVMEFKLDGTPAQALKQIDSNGYAIPYSSDGRTLFKIGVTFSSTTHNISKWKIMAT
ncbi:MAG: ATP-binding protein [Bacteroidales bacterium]|nr:ATP-binding protein [Bacteroidales bacterium]